MIHVLILMADNYYGVFLRLLALYCGGKGKAVAVVDVATQKKLRDIKDAHRFKL